MSRFLRVFVALTGPLCAIAVLSSWLRARADAAAHGYQDSSLPGVASAFVGAEVWHALSWAAGAGIAFSLFALFAIGRRGHQRSLRVFAVVAYALEAAFGVFLFWLWRDWRHTRVRSEREFPEFLWRRGELVEAAAIVTAITLVAAVLVWSQRRRGRDTPWPGNLTTGLGLLATVVAITMFASIRPWTSIEAPRSHNVLFVSWDSTRSDHLSCYGYPRATSPHLDALAREGVVFERAFSQYNRTRTSYASTFTSSYVRDLGVQGMSRDSSTIAEVLRGAGFRTEAFVQNPNLTPEWNFDQGFEHYVQVHDGLPSSDLADLAVGALERLTRGNRPFFLFVHMMEPHYPYRTDGTHVATFADAPEPLLTDVEVCRVMTRRAALEEFTGPDTRAARRWLLDMYDSSIRDADDGLGKLIECLRRRGQLENTLVVFNSDHGDEFHDRESWGHGHANVHPELTHVPLVVRFPGALDVEPARNSELVGNLDIFPTILDTVGLAVPASLAGRSLLSGAAPRNRRLLSYRAYLVAVRSEQHALVRDFWADDGPRFYDLVVDPEERSPLDPSAARAEFDDMNTNAQAWFQAEHGGVVTPAFESTGDISEGLVRRLKALGYL